jgi:hypothetical protein
VICNWQSLELVPCWLLLSHLVAFHSLLIGLQAKGVDDEAKGGRKEAELQGPAKNTIGKLAEVHYSTSKCPPVPVTVCWVPMQLSWRRIPTEEWIGHTGQLGASWC